MRGDFMLSKKEVQKIYKRKKMELEEENAKKIDNEIKKMEEKACIWYKDVKSHIEKRLKQSAKRGEDIIFIGSFKTGASSGAPLGSSYRIPYLGPFYQKARKIIKILEEKNLFVFTTHGKQSGSRKSITYFKIYVDLSK